MAILLLVSSLGLRMTELLFCKEDKPTVLAYVGSVMTIEIQMGRGGFALIQIHFII